MSVCRSSREAVVMNKGHSDVIGSIANKVLNAFLIVAA